jgi:hypothetical protein
VPRIDNPTQLAQLRLRYAAVEGSLSVAQAAQAAAESHARQYLEMLSMLTGLHIQPGARIKVDWDSGDVSVESEEHSTNGVAA